MRCRPRSQQEKTTRRISISTRSIRSAPQSDDRITVRSSTTRRDTAVYITSIMTIWLRGLDSRTTSCLSWSCAAALGSTTRETTMAGDRARDIRKRRRGLLRSTATLSPSRSLRYSHPAFCLLPDRQILLLQNLLWRGTEPGIFASDDVDFFGRRQHCLPAAHSGILIRHSACYRERPGRTDKRRSGRRWSQSVSSRSPYKAVRVWIPIRLHSERPVGCQLRGQSRNAHYRRRHELWRAESELSLHGHSTE